MRDFVSHKIKAIPPSGIREFFDIAATMENVISLGIGEPDFVTPPPLLQAGLQALHSGETHYTSNAGMLELREAISTHLKELYNVEYHPNELLITVGVSEGLYLACNAVLDWGDEVLVPEPCFVSYIPGVEMAGGKAVTIPTYVHNNFEVTGADLEAAITDKTKAILTGYPNNPTGAVLSYERMVEMAEIAEKYDLLVISDEIYSQLIYGVEHICFASLPGMKERTITLNGFSKAYAMTGWRIGYAAAPQPIRDAMYKIHQYTIMSAPTVAQFTAIEAMINGAPFAEEMRQEYDRRRRLIVDGMNSLGLTTFEPHGAFYAFPNIQASGMDDRTFAKTLLNEEQVAVVPGSAFGPSGAGFVRCSYATAYEKIEQALEHLQRFMKRHG